MHAARLGHSKRLQDVLSFWGDGGWHSTMDTIKACNRTAINSIASELRKNGLVVECEQRVDAEGTRSWWYRIPKTEDLGAAA